MISLILLRIMLRMKQETLAGHKWDVGIICSAIREPAAERWLTGSLLPSQGTPDTSTHPKTTHVSCLCLRSTTRSELMVLLTRRNMLFYLECLAGVR